MFGGGFVVVLTVAVLAVDPAFFYPRLSTDPLLYYLKGLAFAETGHTTARLAVNRPPFHYVSLPGVMRAPFMIAFKEFDSQLRAIQLSNIALLAIIATMFAFVLSWIVPRRWHWLAVAYTFGFMLLSPDWVANVFEPLADAPYAAFSVGFIIIVTRVLGSQQLLRKQVPAIAAAGFLFTLTFMTRYTAPFLLLYAGVLAAGRMRHGALHRRALFLITGGVVVGLGILTALSWETIRKYLYLPFYFILRANKTSIVSNLLASALPAQIVPVYNLAFSRSIIVDPYHVSFGSSPATLAVMVVGIAISATMLLGMWRSREEFRPEFWYCVAALAVVGPIIPSATRYFMAYQPFLWIFFYAGMVVLLRPIAARAVSNSRILFAALGLIVITTGALVYLRAERIGGTAGDRAAAISVAGTRRYVNEVGSTFRGLRNFLETLPRDHTLLISEPAAYGRWKAISGLDYYRPDSAIHVAVANHDTYLLVECGTLEICQNFPEWDALLHRGLERYGEFSYDLVFSRMTPHGKARVYRIRNAQ